MIITYIASSGNSYSLTARVMTRTANFHTWEFEPKVTSLQYGERVSHFQKGAAAYQATLVVRGSRTQRRAVLTAMHDDFENDIRNMTPGRVIYGEWYCDCYITTSTTQPDDECDHWTNNTITIYVPSGFWIKEETKSFSPTVSAAATYLDYPYEYAYDYSTPLAAEVEWATDSPFASDFEMKIYGACVNPRVIINGHPYLVYASVAEGETLVINSKEHTVMIGDTNLFDARNKVKSVFEKIPRGNLTVAWEGFDFDLTLFEERSEPKW